MPNADEGLLSKHIVSNCILSLDFCCNLV